MRTPALNTSVSMWPLRSRSLSSQDEEKNIGTPDYCATREGSISDRGTDSASIRSFALTLPLPAYHPDTTVRSSLGYSYSDSIDLPVFGGLVPNDSAQNRHSARPTTQRKQKQLQEKFDRFKKIGIAAGVFFSIAAALGVGIKFLGHNSSAALVNSLF